VDMRWSGIMGLGDSKSSIVNPLSERIFCSVRMGGMGVAIGSLIGEEAAQMILET
jgi:gamma-glutamylputrescine oxidase